MMTVANAQFILLLLVTGFLHSCVADADVEPFAGTTGEVTVAGGPDDPPDQQPAIPDDEFLTVNEGDLFVPTSCRQTCTTKAYNVAFSAGKNFTFNLANSEATKTTASRWAVALLRSVKTAVGTPRNPSPTDQNAQNITITPPAVAKLLGVYSIAVYQAFSVWSQYLYTAGRYFQPISADMINLNDRSRAAAWKSLLEPYGDVFPGNFAPEDAEAVAAQNAAVSGAASKLISLFFCYDEVKLRVWCRAAMEHISEVQADTEIAKDKMKYPLPYQQGEDIAAMVFDQLRLANVLKDTPETLKTAVDNKLISAIANQVPLTQTRTASVHDCAAVGPEVWNWRALTTPAARLEYEPNASKNAVYPPQVWPPVNTPNANQSYRGYASTINTTALVGTLNANGSLVEGLKGPPRGGGDDQRILLRNAVRQVLQTSATLDDRKKVIAEFWADGPESTTPPGHWFKIAFEESSAESAFALPGLDKLDRAVWATLLVGVSLHEAGYWSWKLKADYMGVRPITGIQCLLGYSNSTQNGRRTAFAWRGPYMGVGRRDLSTWQPFQNISFVTPAFPGYVSGHATFSAAAAEALRQIRSGQNTTFVNPAYNCYKTPEGFSQVEPKVLSNTPSKMKYVPGVTDKANTGPRSTGYSPARDVVMCWKTYDDAAKQAADSRMYGGIHIDIDNKDGITIGRRIGETVVSSLAMLSPANYKSKEDVVFRNDRIPEGYRQLKTPEQVLVCPPGTFVRAWDMKYDPQEQLHALGATCSDGSFIGSAGLYSRGTSVDVVTTVADGFTRIGLGLTEIERGNRTEYLLTGVFFEDRDGAISPQPQDDVTQFFGAALEFVYSECGTEQRIVGLATRDADPSGRLGLLIVLCGAADVQDVVVREAAVPSNPVSKLWTYDYMCPLGTYVTRFFGRQGLYVNTLTAQCSRTWNLKTVGVPGLAEDKATYFTHAADGGYIGISVRNGSGNADAISFIPASGSASGFFGNQNTAGAGATFTLRCDEESRVVGLFGWQDAYVASIGIICSPGEFDPLPASIQQQRKLRNRKGPLVIPGRGIVAPSVFDVVPLSVLPLAPIPTHVSGMIVVPQPLEAVASNTSGGGNASSSHLAATPLDTPSGAGNATSSHLAAATPLDAPSLQEAPVTADYVAADESTA